MPAIEFKWSEKGCDVMTMVWVPNYPQNQSEHDADRACKSTRRNTPRFARSTLGSANYGASGRSAENEQIIDPQNALEKGNKC